MPSFVTVVAAPRRSSVPKSVAVSEVWFGSGSWPMPPPLAAAATCAGGGDFPYGAAVGAGRQDAESAVQFQLPHLAHSADSSRTSTRRRRRWSRRRRRCRCRRRGRCCVVSSGQRVGGQVGQVAADVGPGRPAVGAVEDLAGAEAVADGVDGIGVRRIDDQVVDVVGDGGDVALDPGSPVVGGDEDVARAVADVDGVAVHADGVDGADGVEAVAAGRADDRPGWRPCSWSRTGGRFPGSAARSWPGRSCRAR